MILGRVVGQVWATRQDARLAGAKLLVVRPLGAHAAGLATRHLVAVDDVDAGVGDEVVVCLGKPARLAAGGDDSPVDAAILGVVDRVDVDAKAASSPGAAPGIRRPLPGGHA
ncbi:MAG TPA: EutN/CcmL family microcompartment protein [Polyangia bacterium]|nr:EutN/CcmL family microcompartment protein [Polyangia bacterium]